MSPHPRLVALVLLSALAVGACDVSPAEVGAQRSPSTAAPRSTATQDPAEREQSHPQDEKRYIPVGEAVEKIRAHVDVPVVLPRLVGQKGWVADSKYLDWNVTAGIRSASVKLRRDEQILIISYGLAGFDGCGDRSRAVETTVLGRPALVSQAREHLWSTVLWPVTETGSTGRYGLDGTFEAWRIVQLAESMERARLRAVQHSRGC